MAYVAMQFIISGMQNVHFKESVVSEPAEAGKGVEGDGRPGRGAITQINPA